MTNNMNVFNANAIGVLCLSACHEYVCVSASARVFEGKVGQCACYGMS